MFIDIRFNSLQKRTFFSFNKYNVLLKGRIKMDKFKKWLLDNEEFDENEKKFGYCKKI